MKNRIRRHSWMYFLVAIIALEFIIFGLANPKFLRPQLLFTGINDHLAIGIIAIFVTMVMITGGIDIQVPALVGLTSITIGVLWQDMGLNIWLASLIAFIFVGLCGALSGFFIAYCDVQPMVITLGGSFLYSGIALLISTLSATEAYQGISGLPDSFKILGKFKAFGLIPLQFFIFLALILFGSFLLNKTKYGRMVFLVGTNSEAAEYSGIKSRRIIMSTYVLSALSAAVAGMIMTSYLGTAKSDLGGDLTMDIITAVVLGGTLTTGGKGNIYSTALAAIVIAIMKFGMPLCFGINTQYLDIPVGLFLIIVVVGRSYFGRKDFSFTSLLGGKNP
ncbi:ABC transporter permease [Kallipyga massiliensis]|uniref:ABC transporter permease n=1 Tax=Kallipyga massiliensis TaxID=1472764 RepID=UPI000564DB21|nr:ABC transporter permease [Kallipyga massiliensis]